jgi:RNA polymerase sigma-70 factor (ECF subfamily)
MNDGLRTKEELSMDALKRKDRAAFALLVDRYSGVIYRLALKILGCPQDAEDVLQETFLKAYSHIEQFDGRSRISTWLYRIAANEALMLLRKRKGSFVSLEEPAETGEDQDPMQIVDWCCVPEEEMMTGETRAALDKAVEDLTLSLRMVFLLREIEGLSTAETAEVLNLSEMAVKTRLSRARLQLRNKLSAYFGERMVEGENRP